MVVLPLYYGSIATLLWWYCHFIMVVLPLLCSICLYVLTSCWPSLTERWALDVYHLQWLLCAVHTNARQALMSLCSSTCLEQREESPTLPCLGSNPHQLLSLWWLQHGRPLNHKLCPAVSVIFVCSTWTVFVCATWMAFVCATWMVFVLHEWSLCVQCMNSLCLCSQYMSLCVSLKYIMMMKTCRAWICPRCNSMLSALEQCVFAILEQSVWCFTWAFCVFTVHRQSLYMQYMSGLCLQYVNSLCLQYMNSLCVALHERSLCSWYMDSLCICSTLTVCICSTQTGFVCVALHEQSMCLQQMSSLCLCLKYMNSFCLWCTTWAVCMCAVIEQCCVCSTRKVCICVCSAWTVCVFYCSLCLCS